MKEVAVYDAKTRLSELLSAVESGEQVVITRRGVPIARLVAAEPHRPDAGDRARQVAEVFAALRRSRQGVSLDLPLRQAIDNGRD